MNRFGLEIDFLQVGDGERSGDAVALRYGDLPTGFEVMVIDGGNKASGEALVRHITSEYGTTTVGHVLNTHPDGDHSSGLTEVLRYLDVKKLWMHRPWLFRPVSWTTSATLDSQRAGSNRAFVRRSTRRMSLRRWRSPEEPRSASRFREPQLGRSSCSRRSGIGISKNWYRTS